MKMTKKFISAASAAALAVTGFAGTGASAADEMTVLSNSGPYTGSGTYISTHFKSDYYQYDKFEITYKFNSLDADGVYVDNNGETQSVDYADTFDFLVFNTGWGGWNNTPVGQSATPDINTEYTSTVDISVIEEALGTNGTPYGINLQTGAIGDTSVTVVSLKLKKSGTYVQQDFTAEGSWVKGSASNNMTVAPSGAAVVNANEYNIEFSAVDFSSWKNPTVKVTATYDTLTEYKQAEILIPTGEKDSAGNDIYEAVDSNYIKPDAGTYTFATEIPATATKFLVCYDGATVTKVEVFNNTAGDTVKSVTNKTAAQVAEDMGVAWNLGNALESVDGDSSSATYGQVGEKFWGNPKTTKCLIQAVKAQGFNTVRVPVSYINMIESDNTVNDNYLKRVKQVVDYAYDMGMYVVIDMHSDGGNGIVSKWIDITKTGSEFTAINNKFAAVWYDIADYFKDYDQKLVFEGFNELMNGDYNAAPTADQLSNVNTLNQTFVSTVRSAGGNNAGRILIVAGYNTNIAYTISGFTKPEDSDKLMLSVHYYDPYDFTLNESGTASWSNAVNGDQMSADIYSISEFAAGEKINMPVFIGEYSPINKNNTAVRAEYCYWLNYYAAYYGNIVTAYWDNGFDETNGSGLFDRINNTAESEMSVIITNIINGRTNGMNAR